MLINFEDITYELTDDEKKLLPILTAFLMNVKKKNPLKEPQITKLFNDWLPIHRPEIKVKLTGVRLRKIINYIRANGIAAVIGTSKGYYVSTDKEEIIRQISSLKQRAHSINKCADGMMVFLQPNV